jgi:hypothetical protein
MAAASGPRHASIASLGMPWLHPVKPAVAADAAAMAKTAPPPTIRMNWRRCNGISGHWPVGVVMSNSWKTAAKFSMRSRVNEWLNCGNFRRFSQLHIHLHQLYDFEYYCANHL